MIKKLLIILSSLILFAAAGGTAAYLITSWMVKSEDIVIVPDLIQQDILRCLEILSTLGLNTKVKDVVYDSHTPHNSVIRQEPEPGVRIKKGREVRLIISKGPHQITVPALSGLSLREASLLLEQQGLRTGHRSFCFSNIHRRDQVMAQSPMSDTELPRDSSIDMLISLGPEPRFGKTPHLIGLHFREAVRGIEQSGFRLGQVKYAYQPLHPLQRVLEQDPPAGTRIPENTTVNLSINRDPPLSETETFAADTWVRYRLAPGFLRRHIRIQLNMPGISLNLFDRFVRPGEEIQLLAPQIDHSTILIYEDDILQQKKDNRMLMPVDVLVTFPFIENQ